MLNQAQRDPEKYPWLTRLLARRPFKVVAIALANKMAHMTWALLAKAAPILGRVRSSVRLWQRLDRRIGRWESKIASVRSAPNCKGDDDVDAKRSGPSNRTTRLGQRRRGERVLMFGTDEPGSASGPAAEAAASRRRQASEREQAVYMAAPEHFAERSIPLAPRAPFHTWPNASVAAMQRFGRDRRYSERYPSGRSNRR